MTSSHLSCANTENPCNNHPPLQHQCGAYKIILMLTDDDDDDDDSDDLSGMHICVCTRIQEQLLRNLIDMMRSCIITAC